MRSCSARSWPRTFAKTSVAVDIYGSPAMGLEIRPVARRRDLRTFIRLPWRIYRNEPNWVPPLRRDERQRLDPARNPFFEHAEVQLFLAFRDGEPVGRISAQVDRNFNRFQANEWGLFGFFECAEDPEAAAG